MTAPLHSQELAPSLVARVVTLLDEVTLTTAPELIAVRGTAPRCVVCHDSGRLGGHHTADGGVRSIHRSCHRRLHRSGRHDVGPLPAPRRPLTAC